MEEKEQRATSQLTTAIFPAMETPPMRQLSFVTLKMLTNAVVPFTRTLPDDTSGMAIPFSSRTIALVVHPLLLAISSASITHFPDPLPFPFPSHARAWACEPLVYIYIYICVYIYIYLWYPLKNYLS